MRRRMMNGSMVLVLIASFSLFNYFESASGELPPSTWFPGNMELIGHSDLMGRGMNAALAVAGNYVYVGSRTEGETHPNAGVLIVDVSDPSNPKIAGQIGQPDEGLLGMTSRELRAVPDKNLLIVLNFSCSTVIHLCTRDKTRFPQTGGVAEGDNLKFFNISDRVHPKLIGTYSFGTFPGMSNPAKPHEFFLWRDPQSTDRILLYVTTPSGPPSLKVLDVSDPANSKLVTQWDGKADGGLNDSSQDAYLHSLSLSDDGKVAYLAFEAAGFFLVDTSEVAANQPNPKIHAITPIENRVDYTPPYPAGNHSAVKIPNRDLVIATDEIYSKPLFDGCPWGWMRLIDIHDPLHPSIVSEFKLAQNEKESCPSDLGPLQTSFTSHNPTATEHLAIVTWHSGGLRIVDTSNAQSPQEVGVFMPAPIAAAALDDPALGGNPVTMWSYPVIQDGLIYVVDIRNGLYILRYHGPHEEEVSNVHFLEGNSDLGRGTLCGGMC
ncbi:hypothetical protein HY229_06270 [Candidatus Acetothermia bacterium]|nr:hypothetical protein [Candidatus Acetothermia bacterium]MBI3643686.1 hypothetical protein [Candidatus Acetothermia bacterium]